MASTLVEGSFIDDADRLRAGSTAQVLPFGVSAPSTLGTWLRSFTSGHLRQSDRVNESALSLDPPLWWVCGVGASTRKAS